MAAVLASVSAPLSATEIDDLVNTSQSIRDTFAYGIKTIAGGAAYAGDGSIAPEMAKDGQITTEQQNAYNAAVSAVMAATYTYNPGAEGVLSRPSRSSHGSSVRNDRCVCRGGTDNHHGCHC